MEMKVVLGPPLQCQYFLLINHPLFHYASGAPGSAGGQVVLLYGPEFSITGKTLTCVAYKAQVRTRPVPGTTFEYRVVFAPAKGTRRWKKALCGPLACCILAPGTPRHRHKGSSLYRSAAVCLSGCRLFC